MMRSWTWLLVSAELASAICNLVVLKNRKENMKTLKDIDVSNKSVVIRCDFNVPMDGVRITDNRRIVKSLDALK